jgi:ribosomal-protein-alanine N-acetyltransferase
MVRDDLDAIRRLETATPEAPRWAITIYEAFLSANSPARRIFVAEDGDRILGFAAAQVVEDICELESIVVDVAVRRTGLGAALLASLETWARQNSAVRVEVEVRDQNLSAIGFYERIGFRRDGVRRGYYRNPDGDAVLMSLTL